ncbi:MAG: hypothetical protein K2O56_01455, partial [Muribaculaceae bacterium]|nr:hypothetical protein [Muribaculaceae bacterium]
MNELEKTVLAEELVNPTPSETCAVETSPAEDISEAADRMENESAEETPVNYHNMGKAELNEAMRSILAENRMDAHREVTAIKQAFFNIRSRESMEEVNAFVEAGNDPRDCSPVPDGEESEFKT